MHDFTQKALELHTKHTGKLAVVSKTPIENAHDLSLIYTPGVGAVSQAIAKDHSLAKTMTLQGRTVAVISDGSAVLGLGNIGPEAALPVMEGKALLLKHFAGIDAFPLVINTQKSSEIVRFVRQVSPTFFAINLEDISAPRCFEIEEELQDLGIPVFHDDQHGTAVVVAAALVNAAKVVKKPFESLKVGVVGAGAAGLAIAKILLGANCQSSECAYIPNLRRVADVVVFDSKGALAIGRSDMNVYKQAVAGLSNKDRKLGSPEEVLADFDVVIGVSGPGTISAQLIKKMADKAIVFALANPQPEIMPELAKEAGAYVVATGRSDFANQINNVLAFPAIFALAHKLQLQKIEMPLKIALVEALAALVEEPTAEKIIVSPFYPDLVESLITGVLQRYKPA